MPQELSPELVKTLGPVAIILWGALGGIKLYKIFHGDTKVDEPFTSKALAQEVDVVIAANFTQFKDDIKQIIKEQGEANQKDSRNALHELALDLEIFDRAPILSRRRRKRDR